MTTELDARTPEEIERHIEATRESLRGKLNELEHRLSPGERINRVRQRINPDAMAPWAAVGAVATGAVLAVRGLRRHRNSAELDGVDAVDDAVCLVDIAV
jgi:hypothetical protein